MLNYRKNISKIRDMKLKELNHITITVKPNKFTRDILNSMRDDYRKYLRKEMNTGILGRPKKAITMVYEGLTTMK